MSAIGGYDPFSHQPIQKPQYSPGATPEEEANQMYYILGLLYEIEKFSNNDNVLYAIDTLQKSFGDDMDKTSIPVAQMQRQLNQLFNNLGLSGLRGWNFETDQKMPGRSFLGACSYLTNMLGQAMERQNPESSTSLKLRDLASEMGEYENIANPAQWDLSKVANFLNQLTNILKDSSSFIPPPVPPHIF